MIKVIKKFFRKKRELGTVMEPMTAEQAAVYKERMRRNFEETTNGW
jgi:hypothetical protein